MSTWYPHVVACPYCNYNQEIHLLKGMHITRIPDVQRQIIDGTFQVFSCVSCTSSFVVERPSIYTDFDKGHYIAIEPLGSSRKEALMRHQKIFDDVFLFAPDLAQNLANTLNPRLVFGLPALREKILTWEKGLSDHVLEGLKLSIIGRHSLDKKSIVLRLVKIHQTGGHLLFAAYKNPVVKHKKGLQILHTQKPYTWYTASRQDYETILGNITRLRQLTPRLFGGWCVDVSMLDF